jgi:hypothetical protein
MLIEFSINSCVDYSAKDNDERISTYLNERNGIFLREIWNGCKPWLLLYNTLGSFLWVDFWVSYIETFPSSQVVACPILRLACSTGMMVPT